MPTQFGSKGNKVSSEMIVVRSADNNRYRRLLTLTRSSRERRKQRRTVIEGNKLIDAYMDMSGSATSQVHDVFLTQSMRELPLTARLQTATGTNIVWLSDGLFKAASQLPTSTGPIAIIDTPSLALPERFDEELVYLDRVQDPGNVGTILRTCAAAGVRDVVTSSGAAYCWAPKVLRSAMGGHFALRIFEGVEPVDLLKRLSTRLVPRAMVAPDHSQELQRITWLYETDLRAPNAWLIGSEGNGLRAELLTPQTSHLTIDQDRAVESLNVAAATAICLFEARRQRC